MNKIVEFSIQDKGKEVKFIAERLKPFEQFNLIMKIISVVAKGGNGNNLHVEQALHNLFQTGKNVEIKEKLKEDFTPFKLILEAIKGALAQLSEEDRDWMITELLKNVKIDCGASYIVKATQEELNSRLSGFQAIFELLKELVKINLGFL